MKFTEPDITIDKDWLLSRVSEEDILEHYTGAKIGGGHFRSPVRKDRNPTCSFRYGSDGRPRFKDWASNTSYDCFDLVQAIFENCGYRRALEQIAWDFKLSDKLPDNKKNELHQQRFVRRYDLGYRELATKLEVATAPLTSITLKYFIQFGISRNTLDKFWVREITKLWINDTVRYWTNSEDPAIGYYLGIIDGLEQWKIYFYCRDTQRFICNTRRIQGFFQLPKKGPRIVITKSMKDVMTLSELGEPAVAPQGETVVIQPALVDYLKLRFNNVYSLYDWDLTGVSAANRLRKAHGIQALFTHKYGVKDVSDLVKSKGMLFVASLIENYKG